MTTGRAKWIWMAVSVVFTALGIAVLEFTGGVSDRVVYIPLILSAWFNALALGMFGREGERNAK